MMTTEKQKRMERLRKATLEVLAIRVGMDYGTDAIVRRIREGRMMDGEFTEEEVHCCCELLVLAGHATKRPEPLGATSFFQATAAGVLHHERNP